MASSSKRSKAPHGSNVVVIESVQQLEQVVTSSPRAILKFSADWCGPCKRIDPLYQSLSANPANSSIAFLYVDVDSDCGTEIQNMYRVSKLPTFVFVQGPRVLTNFTLEGADENALQQRIEAFNKLNASSS